MFFSLSKILWWLADPSTLVFLALLLGVALLWLRRKAWGVALVSCAAIGWAVLATVPLGAILFQILEDRFPTPAILPARIDGLIVLGGAVEADVTRGRGQLALNGAVERLVSAARLARQFPDATVIFSGGSGDFLKPDIKEADALGPYLSMLGLDPLRVRLEGESRNTFENAERVLAMARPGTGESWLLITSARHMPRAVGCFRRVGFPVVPYPVDYMLPGDRPAGLAFDPIGGLGAFSAAIHEWLGLFAYWLTDRTDAFFPAPEA